MKLTSSALERSFLNEEDRGYEEEQNGEEIILSGTDNMDENNNLEQGKNQMLGTSLQAIKEKWL